MLIDISSLVQAAGRYTGSVVSVEDLEWDCYWRDSPTTSTLLCTEEWQRLLESLFELMGLMGCFIGCKNCYWKLKLKKKAIILLLQCLLQCSICIWIWIVCKRGCHDGMYKCKKTNDVCLTARPIRMWILMQICTHWVKLIALQRSGTVL